MGQQVDRVHFDLGSSLSQEPSQFSEPIQPP